MNDIQGHWAEACIKRLVQQGIVAGYPDGSFKPEQPVTRAEFAALIVQAFLSSSPATRPAVSFVDVPRDYWTTAKITKTYVTGWLTGYPERRFRPNLPIPKVRAVIALTAGLGYSAIQPITATLTQVFVDASDIPPYAQEKTAAAVEQQLIVNYPDIKRFRANKPATRAEIAALLCQALARQSSQPSLIRPNYVVRLASVSPLATTEIRGTWLTNIDSEVLFSQTSLVSALDRLAQHNFNTVYPTVWSWGYPLYPSTVAQRIYGYSKGLYPDIENEGRDEVAEVLQGDRDMLKELIEAARSRHLSVIPWFEFGLLAPANSPLIQQHPNWITRRYDGTHIEYHDNGKYARAWLCPWHPEVQGFLVEMVSELSANYDIDGFQIDDHFGLPVDFGYDELSRSLYRQATGNTPPANAQAPAWMRWRADQITQLMAKLFQALKAKRPQALFSVSPSPASFAYDRYLQDWPAWERSGYIEELIVQLYRRNLSGFLPELERPDLMAARDHISTAIGILTGLKQDSIQQRAGYFPGTGSTTAGL